MNGYQQLRSFEDFAEITRDCHYLELPGDWWIIVADIIGSTQAAKEGRYRDVNTLGAAVIVAAHNQLGEDTFPFVFGGDGATLVIPPHALDGVAPSLAALRDLASARFNLQMRVGAVRISELDGARVEVAKLSIAGKRSLAVFRGGGLTRAEELIKQGGGHELPAAAGAATADLGGLSCRWLPITPARDHAASLLVKSRAGDEVYQKVLDAIAMLYDGRMEQANPIHLKGARYRSVRQCLADEVRYHQKRWSLKFAWRVFEIIAAVLIFRHGAPGPFNAANYAGSMARHSDYRKFDDMLRMVIDCTADQAAVLRAFLQGLQDEGAIDFGLHLADESLMTCFFHGPDEGEHIHFIDGGNGGYMMAAMEMKQQMRAREGANGPPAC